MSASIVSVENLGKKYQISHLPDRQSYTALRDVITEGTKRLFRMNGYRNQVAKHAVPVPVEDFWALRELSFEVKEGEILGIIGRNGAGKSTLLKVLSRITEPSTGRVALRGRVGSLLEVGTGFHPELTGRENIFLNGAILGMKKTDIVAKFDEIVAFSEVEKFLDTPVKRYSSGMYTRLAFAVAAHLEPEILIVDEVLAVGDAEFQKKCLGKMESVGRSGRTVLFVSHNMAAVERLCSRAILLKGGRLALEGTTADTIRAYVNSQGSAGKGLAPRYAARGFEVTDLNFEIKDKDLIVSCTAKCIRAMPRVGIGIRITSQSGEIIAMLKPLKTGVIIPGNDGAKKVRVRMPRLLSLLPEGQYHVTVWFNEPKLVDLLTLDDVYELDVPYNDAYSTGHSIVQAEDGLAVLPIELCPE